MRRHLILTLALTFAALGAQAQPTAKKDYVQRILAAQQAAVENIGRALAAQTSQQVLEAASAPLSQIPADKQEAVGKAIQADVKQFYDDIEPPLKASAVKFAPATVGSVLEDKFTEDELKQITAWVESPVSKKYQQFTPDMQDALTQKLVADSRSSVEGKLKALEDGIRKRLEEAAGKSSSSPSSSKPPAKKKN